MTLVLRSWRAARLLAQSGFIDIAAITGKLGGRAWQGSVGRRGRAVLSGKAGRPGRLAVPGPAVPQRVGRRPARVRRPGDRVRDRAADVAGPRLPQVPLRAGPGANLIR